MGNPHSNIPPHSFGCNSLAAPQLQYSSDQLNLQNDDFTTHLGSSSSSSPFPFLDECYNIQTHQQQEVVQQTPYTFTSSSSSSSAPAASTYPFTNIAPVESGGVQHYLINNNYDQMGVPSWWPLHTSDQMGNSTGGSSSLLDVVPATPHHHQHSNIGPITWSEVQQQQQQAYGATTTTTTTISSSTTCSSAPTCLGSWMDPNQNMPLTLQYSPYTQDFTLFPSLEHMGYGFVLQKELRNSDVNNIGRIVLPKRESESTLPFLSVKEGIQLSIMELFNPCVWRMRYRFWPNNKSRMYVLENTGEFIRRHGLKCGDYIAIYQDNSKQLYICSRRVERPLQQEDPTPSSTTAGVSAAQMSSAVDMQTMEAGHEMGQRETRDSLAYAEMAGFFDNTSLESGDNTFQFTDPSASLFDTTPGDHYSTRHLESLPNIEDCDLSIYDDVPEKSSGDRVVK